MNLRRKTELASKVLGVGKNRIKFDSASNNEIREAITRQDISDLHKSGIISIKPIKGRKKIIIRKTKKGPGKIKMNVNKRKQTYVKLTRKLRAHLKELRARGEINRELYKEIRKKVKARAFKSKANLKEYLASVETTAKTAEKTQEKTAKKTSEKSEDKKKKTRKRKIKEKEK